MIRRLFSVLLLIAITLSLVGCLSERNYEYCEIGFSLPRSYRQIDAHEDFDLAFERRNTVIGIRRFSFDVIINEGILPTNSALKFAEIYRDRLEGVNPTPIYEYGYIPYFVYSIYSSGKEYTYMPTFYRTPYAYFVIILVSKSGLNKGGRVEFLDICDSVYILPQYT